jgi:hydroxypyruvate isomerase
LKSKNKQDTFTMLDHISNLGRRDFMTLSAAAGASFLLNGRDSRAAAASTAPTAAIEKPGKTPNTRFAVNVEMWFRGKSFLEKIHAADELGYPAIEFWPYEGKPIEKAAKLLKEKNIAVSQFTAWGFGTELNNPKSDHERFVKTIRESCDVADRLDCHLFTVVIGNDIQGVSKDAMHAAAIAGLKRAAPICEKRGKTIIIEPMNPRNHPGHCLYGSRDAINICKAVGSEAVKIN